VGDRLFFAAEDGERGRELWTSDGSRAGTVLVKNINAPTDTGSFGYPAGSRPYFLSDVEGRLFFTADDGTHGEELWTSDGSRAGTVLLKDIHPCSDEYYPSAHELTAVGERLFFTADDGVHGWELWTSDGSRAGTVLVKDIKAGTTR
jgi:ELWxxDGT repeat protein